MIGAMSSFRPFASSERQSENQSEPPGFERSRVRDRSLVQAERPRPVDLDTPALGAELRNRLRDKTDAGPARSVVFVVADRREDDIRFAQLARQGVIVVQQFVILVAVPLRRLP